MMNLSSIDGINIERITYLQQQEALFEQAKPHLLEQYLGEFIAFENEVLDHDQNEQNLAERVYKKYGYRDILIKQVLHQDPKLFVRGFMPNLQR
ncbi:hypothetical protein IQ250_23695 [Pseudanabaenaceae cyanobacterium LEGE 13415]|nr:hypothetical protein [Pseudanabaenaceae cyanobacterium LEGE 13415]